jgi:hypothetical protein
MGLSDGVEALYEANRELRSPITLHLIQPRTRYQEKGKKLSKPGNEVTRHPKCTAFPFGGAVSFWRGESLAITIGSIPCRTRLEVAD